MQTHKNNQEKNSYVRSQILAALLQAMRQKPLGAISVSELTAAAQVGRASFYRNYTSKEDVLRQESDRLMRLWLQSWQQRAAETPPPPPNEFLVSLLDFYKAHADFYLALYRAGMADLVRDAILQRAELTPAMPNAEAYLRSAMAYMVYGWVIEWMHRGMPESGSELARMMAAGQPAQG